MLLLSLYHFDCRCVVVLADPFRWINLQLLPRRARADVKRVVVAIVIVVVVVAVVVVAVVAAVLARCAVVLVTCFSASSLCATPSHVVLVYIRLAKQNLNPQHWFIASGVCVGLGARRNFVRNG